jgi:hypothetical protein
MDASVATTVATTPRSAKPGARRLRTLVRWEFERGTQRLCCQVDRQMNADDSATFSVIHFPYRYLSLASSELFDHAASALRRHAALARDLRDAGWRLVSYTR